MIAFPAAGFQVGPITRSCDFLEFQHSHFAHGTSWGSYAPGSIRIASSPFRMRRGFARRPLYSDASGKAGDSPVTLGETKPVIRDRPYTFPPVPNRDNPVLILCPKVRAAPRRPRYCRCVTFTDEWPSKTETRSSGTLAWKSSTLKGRRIGAIRESHNLCLYRPNRTLSNPPLPVLDRSLELAITAPEEEFVAETHSR